MTLMVDVAFESVSVFAKTFVVVRALAEKMLEALIVLEPARAP
jgi:hypothetical protein